MRYMVVIEKGASSYGAFVPDLPGCIAAGETEAEALALIEEDIQFHLEDMQAGGFKYRHPHRGALSSRWRWPLEQVVRR